MTTSTRKHLLATAAGLYGANGFRGTTTRRIAEESGINEVTIFRLFGSKSALLLEAIRAHGIGISAEELPLSPCDPLAELTDWSAHHWRMLRARRGMIRQAMSEFETHPDIPGCMEDGATAVYTRLSLYFERLQTTGFVDACANVHAATTMLLSALVQDAIARDVYPELFPYPSGSAPAAYARLALLALGCDPQFAKAFRYDEEQYQGQGVLELV